MTHDELWLRAVNRALDLVEDSQHEQFIKDLLEEVHGDVSRALKLMTQVKPGWYDTTAQLLGGWGYYANDHYSCQCQGSAAAFPIEAWLPGGDRVNGLPDLVIPWREVFEYVKAGRKRAVQLAMF